MVFKIFAREGCTLCTKAQEILKRLGVNYELLYVDGDKATAENLAAFAYYDWTDTIPLIVVTHDNKVLAKWDGNVIGDKHGSWYKTLEKWLIEQGLKQS